MPDFSIIILKKCYKPITNINLSNLFQTVIKGDDKTEYHIGYFRDVPDDPPVFLADNTTSKNCILNPVGLNIFSAVKYVKNIESLMNFTIFSCF